MTAKAKSGISLIMLGTIAGSLIAILTLKSTAEDSLNKYIDGRIKYQTQYIVELLKQITTPEQQQAAETAVRRWNGKGVDEK